jgi:hypothetical protein
MSSDQLVDFKTWLHHKPHTMSYLSQTDAVKYFEPFALGFIDLKNFLHPFVDGKKLIIFQKRFPTFQGVIDELKDKRYYIHDILFIPSMPDFQHKTEWLDEERKIMRYRPIDLKMTESEWVVRYAIENCYY